jgi:hypothetical protein
MEVEQVLSMVGFASTLSLTSGLSSWVADIVGGKIGRLAFVQSEKMTDWKTQAAD